MSIKIFGNVLVISLLAASGSALAQDPPSVDAIIESLKADTPAPGPGATRALRPGAASMSTTAPAPAAKPKPASINMQINFEYNSAEIDGSSERTMATLAKALASPQLASRTFAVIGHTDASGSAAYNKALSDRRAAAVRRYLTENGVDASRLKARGMGESQLLNKSEPDASENRRVEIQASGG